MGDFFGFDHYENVRHGVAYGWEHLLFVSIFAVIAIGLAIFLGLHYRKRALPEKNKVIIMSSIAIDTIEIFKIVFLCIREKDPLYFLHTLPLHFCSIFLIAIPLAALSKGRLKEASLDFIAMFGILGAAAGTYGAANLYSQRPVFCFENLISATTHWISGFVSLYIIISNMMTLKLKNTWIVVSILATFFGLALIADYTIPPDGIKITNYMYLRSADGTPYKMFYAMVNGNPVLYPMVVFILFALYASCFYGVYYLILHIRAKKTNKE